MHYDQGSNASIEPQTATMTPTPTNMTVTAATASLATAAVASFLVPFRYWYLVILIYSAFSSMNHIVQSGNANGSGEQVDIFLWKTLTLGATPTYANNNIPAAASVTEPQLLSPLLLPSFSLPCQLFLSST